MARRTAFAVLAVALLAASAAAALQIDRPWLDKAATGDPAQRAAALLAKMSITDKIAMVHGVFGPYVGNVPANPTLGIPALNLNDGPQGFRAPGHDGTSTQWSSGLGTAASWDRDVMLQWGTAMGVEFSGKGANIQLGPAVCLARVPEEGRNFEYMGEDPFLVNQLVQPAVQGIQSQGVMATTKHFVDNSQETNRGSISENVDERTEFEMYLPGFEGAVQAGTLAIMCSYNKINYTWSCENGRTLGYLKKTLGYNYFVMSDWGATHSTVESAVAGLDQEMPTAVYFGSALQSAVENNTVPMSVLDDKVSRILTAMFTIGLFDRQPTGNINNNVTSVAHNQLARTIASQAAILLKNDDKTLPLQPGTNVKNIAVIGKACSAAAITGGCGSGSVVPPYIITPLQGITNRGGAAVTVTYVADNTTMAVAAAKAADVALVCTAISSCEGSDRVNLSLPYEEDEMIAAVAAAQPNTVALVVAPGPVLMPWADAVKSIVLQYMPGQEAGNALADVLFGDVNPSGRTPLTIPVTNDQMPLSQLQWPGLPASNPVYSNYTERLEVGYRWYTAHKSTPLFAFGHGLSYTTFAYTGLQVSRGNAVRPISVAFTVENTGSVAGAEVAQLYLGFPAASGEPPMQLKAFDKVMLQAGEKQVVAFELTPRDVSIWDTTAHDWAAVSGEFQVYVGASSADIRLTSTIAL